MHNIARRNTIILTFVAVKYDKNYSRKDKISMKSVRIELTLLVLGECCSITLLAAVDLSNHPFEQKIAAFRCYIQRMLTLPFSQICINEEWTVICAMANSNGFPEGITHNLRKKLTLKKPAL